MAWVFAFWEILSPFGARVDGVRTSYLTTSTFITKDTIRLFLDEPAPLASFDYFGSNTGKPDNPFEDHFATFKFHIRFFGIDFAYGTRGTQICMGFSMHRFWLLFPLGVLIVVRFFEQLGRRGSFGK